MSERIPYSVLSVFFVIILVASSCTTGEEIETENPDIEWSFVVFSDVQQGYGIYSKLSSNIAEINPAPILAICCGDIMLRSANEVEWLNFKRYSKPITDRTTLLIARGNHEGNDPISEQVLREMWFFPEDLFYYSYTKENCRFIILDTQDRGNEPGISDIQADWLKNQLDVSSQDTSIKYLFIFMHQPVFAPGELKNPHLVNAGEVHQIFTGYKKIKAILSGHYHLFNRNKIDDINYIITGGGGGDLRPGYGGYYHHFVKISLMRNPDRLNLKTIGIFNEVIEDFDL